MMPQPKPNSRKTPTLLHSTLKSTWDACLSTPVSGSAAVFIDPRSEGRLFAYTLPRGVAGSWKGGVSVRCNSVTFQRPFTIECLGNENMDVCVCVPPVSQCDCMCMSNLATVRETLNWGLGLKSSLVNVASYCWRSWQDSYCVFKKILGHDQDFRQGKNCFMQLDEKGPL